MKTLQPDSRFLRKVVPYISCDRRKVTLDDIQNSILCSLLFHFRALGRIIQTNIFYYITRFIQTIILHALVNAINFIFLQFTQIHIQLYKKPTNQQTIACQKQFSHIP